MSTPPRGVAPSRHGRRIFMTVGIALVTIAGCMFMAGALLAGRLEHAFTRDTLLAPEARAAALRPRRPSMAR